MHVGQVGLPTMGTIWSEETMPIIWEEDAPEDDPIFHKGPLFAFKNDLERSTGSGSEKDGKAETAGPDEERKTEPAAS